MKEMDISKSKRKKTIATKFIFLTSTLILATAAIITLFVIHTETDYTYQELLSHGQSTAAMIAQNSEYAIYTEDQHLLGKLLESTNTDSDIAYAVILNNKGDVLASSVKDQSTEIPVKLRIKSITQPDKLLSEEIVNTKNGRKYFDIIAPVMAASQDDSLGLLLTEESNAHQETVGYVQIGLSHERLYKRIKEFLYSILAFTFFLVLTGIVLTVFITRRITNPLAKLHKAIHAISYGKFDHKIDINTRDETMTLVNAFNNMIEQLRNYRSQVEVYTRDLERSNAELQQFATIASHDLKEPLRKISAFSDRLNAKCGESMNEQGRDYLNRIKNSALRAQDLVESLLIYSQITSNAGPHVTIDLSTVAREALSDLEFLIEHTAGRVEFEDMPTVHADPSQMRQLFQNLIGNSLKFNKENVPPFVKVSAITVSDNGNGHNGKEADSEFCQIRFEDNGIGFDEKYTDRIFNVFQRLHGRNQYEGTGVGLSICQKIVHRHGGTISAKSAPGEGATFIVTLPVGLPKEINPEDNGNSHGETGEIQ